jgi:hypothetical protein
VIGLTFYQWYRNQSAQSVLLSDVGTIKAGVVSIDTQLRHVNSSPGGFLQLTQFNAPHDVPQLVLGKPFMMNMAFGNKGTAPVHNAVQFTAVLLVNDVHNNHAAAGRAARRWFATQLAKHTWPAGVDVGVGIELWQTAATGLLGRQDLENIQSRTFRFVPARLCEVA